MPQKSETFSKRVFGAHQHLGYQIALEVQFVEDFGSVGMGPDCSAVFGFSKFLCDIDSQSGPNLIKTRLDFNIQA